MKYLSYELIATTNEWTNPTQRELRLAKKGLHSAFEKYRRELESLRPRLSKAAWDFFMYGRDEYGLHDARLLSLRIGDGLDYTPDGSSSFRLNHQHTSAILEFLNYEQSLHYTFDLRRVSRVQSDLFAYEESSSKSLGDLYLLELTASEGETLQLGFLFASGASLVLEFRRLVFRRRRIKRKYQIGEMYS
jgi:hypothetical protein